MTEFTQGKALVIGVAKYLRKPLPNVANDANDVAALLVDPQHCGYSANNVRTLIDGAATKAAILEGLAWLSSAAEEEDTAIVYFSGHGDRDDTGAGDQGFLVPIDAESNPAQLISGDELTAALQAITAKRVTLLMDACHSGATGTPKGVTAMTPAFTESDYDRLAAGAGRVVIASSRPDEYSYTYAHMRNSVFTDALLRALRGEVLVRGDGLIRIMDVFDFISERVPARQPNQHPWFKGHAIESNFPLALYRGGAKSIDHPALPSGRDGDWWKRLEVLAAGLYPSGPNDSALWSRAGGDPSRLRTSDTPRGVWHHAVKLLSAGGGGKHISADTLLNAMKDDFANNIEITALLRA